MNNSKKVFFALLFVLFSFVYAHAHEFYRDDAEDVVIDQLRDLMWKDDMSVSEVEKTYIQAKEYCQELEFAGFNDWYLPDVDELKSIVKAENYPRSIFKVFKNVASDYYWSSSEYTSEYAWLVLFIYEDVVYYHKNDTNHVRCVRKTR